jgi:tetratricopeptide (TPR) repeat protein
VEVAEGASPGPRAWVRFSSAAALVFAVLLIYGQAIRFPFVEWDDPFYLSRNPTVKAGLTAGGVAWAFTTNELANWHPLTWLSLMLDVQLGGPDAALPHATNLLLHALNALLLLLVLARATGRWLPSWIVAALFAVHPLHVESVAWISERKGLLSTFFGLLAVAAYVGYAKRGGVRRYLLVSLCFAASLMAKPMLVTLPVLLLLLDRWPLCRFDAPTGPTRWRLFGEKLPLLALSAGSVALSLIAQEAGGAMRPGESLALSARLANATVACVWYLQKLFVPTNLAALYTHPYLPGGTPWSPTTVLASAALLLAISFVALRARRRPYLLVGWLWYLISLTPTLGFVQLGYQPFADRYSYVPAIGICIALTWGVLDLLRAADGGRRWLRALVGAAAGFSLLVLGLAAWEQVATWRDSFTLFGRILAVSPQDPVAYFKLGNLYRDERNPDGALANYREAIRIHPGFVKAQINLGHELLKLHREAEAIPHFLEAAKSPYSEGKAHRYLGFAYYSLGHPAEAIPYFREAVRLDPDDAHGYNALGAVLEQTGANTEALEAYRKAASLDPAWAAPKASAARLEARLPR